MKYYYVLSKNDHNKKTGNNKCDRNVRKLETSLIAGERIKRCSYIRQFDNILKVNHNFAIALSTLLSNIYPTELKHRYTQKSECTVCSIITHQNPEFQTIQMLIQ